MVAAGIDVSVAVDGGASNDTGDYLGELRQAFLMHRIRGLHPAPHDGVNATEPHQMLRIGTRGGAAVLNRDDLGSLEPGKAADVVLYDMTKLDFAGGLHDPLAALILCGESHIVDTTIVNGEILVQDGELTRLCEADISEGANQAAAKLIERASRLTN
jgi:cytosine/adenosine deaminase-related metal-dependent hydrolase